MRSLLQYSDRARQLETYLKGVPFPKRDQELAVKLCAATYYKRRRE